jgi:hypothetical protein
MYVGSRIWTLYIYMIRLLQPGRGWGRSCSAWPLGGWGPGGPSADKGAEPPPPSSTLGRTGWGDCLHSWAAAVAVQFTVCVVILWYVCAFTSFMSVFTYAYMYVCMYVRLQERRWSKVDRYINSVGIQVIEKQSQNLTSRSYLQLLCFS